MLAVLLTALIPVTSVGTAQADAMINWPDVTGLVKVVRPMTAHGGHFLVETTYVLQYYLPDTTWRQWSNTETGTPEYYQQAITRHYFSVVILSFTQTPRWTMRSPLNCPPPGTGWPRRCAPARRSSTCGRTQAECDHARLPGHSQPHGHPQPPRRSRPGRRAQRRP